MGFRNPVNSLSGDQITPGVITGSVLQTAAAGRRVVVTGDGPLSYAAAPEVGFFTGDARETVNGRIRSGVALGSPIGSNPGGDAGYLEITPPGLASGNGASIAVYGKSSNGIGRTLLSLYAQRTVVNGGPIEVGYPIQIGDGAGGDYAGWKPATTNPVIPWAPYSAGLEPAYRIDAAGRVTLRGLMKNGYFGTSIFFLPPGFRPAQWSIYSALVSIDGVEKTIRVDVYPDGNVSCGTGVGSVISYLSLAGISFLADA